MGGGSSRGYVTTWENISVRITFFFIAISTLHTTELVEMFLKYVFYTLHM